MSTSSEVKHTPGPWSISDIYHDDVVDATGELLAGCYGMQHGDVDANARLISAAPEMLEALVFANAELRILGHKPETHSVIGKIQAAIAKAEGKG